LRKGCENFSRADGEFSKIVAAFGHFPAGGHFWRNFYGILRKRELGLEI
jgi:hypothetical protein